MNTPDPMLTLFERKFPPAQTVAFFDIPKPVALIKVVRSDAGRSSLPRNAFKTR
ncbi:MAG TPA: hypothetical protein VGD59_03915 [Acidisarcina sp.]